jgi:hypothetical protein
MRPPVDFVGCCDERIGESARRIARQADVGIRPTALLIVDSRQADDWSREHGVSRPVIDAAIIVLNGERTRGDRVRSEPRACNNLRVSPSKHR